VHTRSRTRLVTLVDFADVLHDNLPLGLQVPRETDHSIDLVEHAKPPAHRVYRLSPAEEAPPRERLGGRCEVGKCIPRKTNKTKTRNEIVHNSRTFCHCFLCEITRNAHVTDIRLVGGRSRLIPSMLWTWSRNKAFVKRFGCGEKGHSRRVEQTFGLLPRI